MAWDRSGGTDPKYQSREHRTARAALVKAYQPGDSCAICGHPMWPAEDGSLSHLHADHDPHDPTRYRGLTHGSQPCEVCGMRCNVRDGAVRGRARQETPTRWKL
jgi:hypothetical protein